MSHALRRVILFGLASHAFAMSTMFAIVSGLIENGTKYIPAFAGSAIALILVALLVYRRNTLPERKTFLIAGTVTMAFGVAAMVWIDPGQIWVPLLFFGGLGALMMVRMSQTVNDMKFIRQALLDQYKLDLQLIVLFTFSAIFFDDDPTWQTKMVPFFVLFLFLRMSALSMASKLERGVKDQVSRREKLQNNLPMLVVAVIAFCGWIFNALGVPVFRSVLNVVAKLLLPIFYGIGFLVEYLVGWVKGRNNQEHLKQKIEEMKQAQESEYEFIYEDDGSHLFNETTLFILTAAGMLLLVWYVLRRMKQAQQLRFAEGIVEVREFIHDEKPKKAGGKAVLQPGPLTPMRKAYRRFLFGMKKAGYERGKGETAKEHIEKIAQAEPHLRSSMQELTDYYMQERYGSKKVENKLPRAEELTDYLVHKNENGKQQ
jgi:hypothetical protein